MFGGRRKGNILEVWVRFGVKGYRGIFSWRFYGVLNSEGFI